MSQINILRPDIIDESLPIAKAAQMRLEPLIDLSVLIVFDVDEVESIARLKRERLNNGLLVPLDV